MDKARANGDDCCSRHYRPKIWAIHVVATSRRISQIGYMQDILIQEQRWADRQAWCFRLENTTVLLVGAMGFEQVHQQNERAKK